MFEIILFKQNVRIIQLNAQQEVVYKYYTCFVMTTRESYPNTEVAKW